MGPISYTGNGIGRSGGCRSRPPGLVAGGGDHDTLWREDNEVGKTGAKDGWWLRQPHAIAHTSG